MAGACGGAGGGGGPGEFMLFGVRVVVDSMRKSVSLNNLSQYDQPQGWLNASIANLNSTDAKESGGINDDNNNNNHHKEDSSAAGGYVSADDAVHHSTGSRGERKRGRCSIGCLCLTGVPWTEEEHKLFLLGLQRVGKGDWRGISRNFVKTRTPTQVASHAQKYFLRRSNLKRRRRRSSLFDITTDSVIAAPMEEEQAYQQNNISCPLRPSPPETRNISHFPAMPAFPVSAYPAMLPVPMENPMEKLTLGQGNDAVKPTTSLIRPIPVLPDSHASVVADLDLNLASTTHPSSQSLGSRHSVFKAMSSFNNGDSIISVA